VLSQGGEEEVPAEVVAEAAPELPGDLGEADDDATAEAS
jgi:hypothetical protein